MFKKLGKKGLLSLLTVAAVVVTTVGSFAVWDQLSDTTTGGTLTMDKPVTVTATAMNALTKDATYVIGSSDNPVYEGDVEFTVADVPNDKLTNAKLTLSTKVMNGDTDVSNQFDVAYYESNGTTPVADGVDTGLTNTAQQYKLKVTPKDTATDLSGQELNVNVTGTLGNLN